MSAHTPGPWTMNATPPGRYIITTTVRDFPGTPEVVLAEVYEDSPNPAGDTIVADGEPNARLMATAPELLAALKGALELVDDLRLTFPDAWRSYVEAHGVDSGWRAAIAKAEGAQ